MRRNVGTTDRMVRGALAVVLLVVALLVGVGSVGGVIALVLAVVMAATAVLRFCPLYTPLKIDTCGRR